MKNLKRIFLYAIALLAALALGLTISVFLFKDRIIQQFIREANKNLNTPVSITKIEVTLLEDFPNLSIVCREVSIEDSYPGKEALFTAKSVAFQLHPWEVWKGNYTIKGLTIRDSETHLKINRKGESNFNILKKSEDAKTTSSVRFSLKNVRLSSSVVYYTDTKSAYDFELITTELISSISSQDDVYLIDAKGDLSTGQFKVGKTEIMANKDFDIETSIRYFDKDLRLQIEPSLLKLAQAAFEIKGEYAWQSKNVIDLKVEGQQSDIQTLLSLLPASTAASLSKYQSAGDVYFKGSLRGEISQQKNPAISVEFGFNKATISHPDYPVKVENAVLNGSYASNDVMKTEEASLILNDISGSLNGETFNAKLIFQNLSDPDVMLQFKGSLDAQSLLAFYPVPGLSEASGSILADIAFEGKPSWLQSKSTAQKATATGTIEINNLSFVYGTAQIPFKNLQGNLQFNNNDLALSGLKGEVGKSDFVMNGFFKNIITFLLFENQPIGIETDLKSHFIDLDELFAYGFATEQEGKEYEFNISPNIYLNFNCQIDQLNYKRFNASAIKGDLLVKNQVAVSRNLTLNTMQGNMTLNGIMDANNPKAIDVVSSFKMNEIAVDSVFYVFEDFDQEFIKASHLKGITTADVSLEMTLDQHLQLFPETLVADISATIRKGELNNFEPLQALNKYLDDEGLAQLRFAELKNDIHIENKTIYIPQMEIRSNVTVMQLSGTHTFDQQLNYRVVAPLRNKKKINIEEAGSALEEMEGKTKVYLKITGTTDDYDVQYDTEAVRKKLANDFKKEVQELKDAFKLKGKQKKKELEVSDEEFDW